MIRPRGIALVAALGLFGPSGCGTPLYIARLGWSEARILLRRTPITEVLARPDLSPAVRERLALVLRVREFGQQVLGLRVGDSYTTFAEVTPDEAVVWVVSAAHRDRLEAYTWWYPIAGRVPYRGFFARADAQAEAGRLAASDLDTDVRRALAFSTLGWFADPLLSTTAAVPPVELADTVLHELFHATVYVPGAAAFNESAANMVGHRGAIAFFCREEGTAPAPCVQARAAWADELRRGAVLGRLRQKLERLYGRHPRTAVREARRAWLAAAAARALGEQDAGPDHLVPPNNARLLGELLYLTALDRFDRLVPAGGDLAPAIRTLAVGAPGARDPFELLPPASSVALPAGVHTAARCASAGACARASTHGHRCRDDGTLPPHAGARSDAAICRGRDARTPGALAARARMRRGLRVAPARTHAAPMRT